MKLKGFTLIELLAVIVILGIILAIAIPSIAGIINSSTKSSFQSDAKMVLKALDYKLLEEDTFDITSINEENITNELKLSNDNYELLTVKIVNNKAYVTIVGKNKWVGLTAYGNIDDMKVVNSSDYDVTPPIINLVGISPATVGAGSTYTDAGATASDNHDGDITSKIIVVNNVDTSRMGTYTITYNVKDNSGNSAKEVTRTVNVVDSIKPVITMNGSSTVTIMQGSIYTDAGATGTDNIDGNITSNIVTTSTVNPNTAGTYTVTYNVSDAAGNAATTQTRTIIVLSNVQTFIYTGSAQNYSIPISGTYKIETWGAKGGDNTSSTCSNKATGGQGAYVYGERGFNANDALTINVASGTYGGYNGGAGAGRSSWCGTDYCGVPGNGGGATTISLSGSNIIIAGGGGGAGSVGASNWSCATAGNGGNAGASGGTGSTCSGCSNNPGGGSIGGYGGTGAGGCGGDVAGSSGSGGYGGGGGGSSGCQGSGGGGGGNSYNGMTTNKGTSTGGSPAGSSGYVRITYLRP